MGCILSYNLYSFDLSFGHILGLSTCRDYQLVDIAQWGTSLRQEACRWRDPMLAIKDRALLY